MLVTTVQGQTGDQVGVVNMEIVFTQYMATPLFEARDAMQAQYNEEIEDLSDEEASQLFMDYQIQLEALETEFAGNVEKAIKTVAEKNGFQVVVDAAAVLHGGVDVTDQILSNLN